MALPGQKPPDLDATGNPVSDQPPDLDEAGNPVVEPQKEQTFAEKHPYLTRTIQALTSNDPNISNYQYIKTGEPRKSTYPFITGMGKSIIPEMQHQPTEGWLPYIGKGLYNALISPLGTAEGIMGASSPSFSTGGVTNRNILAKRLEDIGKQAVEETPKPQLRLGGRVEPVKELGPATFESQPTSLPPSERWPANQNTMIAGTPGNVAVTGTPVTVPYRTAGKRVTKIEDAPEIMAKLAGIAGNNEPTTADTMIRDLVDKLFPGLERESTKPKKWEAPKFEQPSAEPRPFESTYPEAPPQYSKEITPTPGRDLSPELRRMAADGEINYNDLNLYEQLGIRPSSNRLVDVSKTPGLSSTDFLSKLANLSGRTTRIVLGFHFPGTALSFHGVNEAIRNTLFGGEFGPLAATGRLADAMTYLFRPNLANDYLKVNSAKLGEAIADGGLRVMTTDIGKPLFKGENIITKGFNYLTDPKPLFGQVIPALKLKSYESLLENYTKSGMPYKKAAQVAGEATNNIFGGLNLQHLERNYNTQKLFRAVALAPDWLETNYRLGKGMFNAIKDPTNPAYKQYMVGATNFLGAYITANVLNAVNNDGKFSFQNDIGHETDVAIGKDSTGRIRYIRPFGTAMDMFRIPIAIGHAAVKNGDIGEIFRDMRTRLSEPAQFATDLLSNTDWKGFSLYGKTKYGKPQGYGQQALNIGLDAVSHFTPVGLAHIADYLRGNVSGENAIAGGLQLPVGYKKPEK